jgi:hypothetical protein
MNLFLTLHPLYAIIKSPDSERQEGLTEPERPKQVHESECVCGKSHGDVISSLWGRPVKWVDPRGNRKKRIILLLYNHPGVVR